MRVILSCTTTYQREDIFYYCAQSLLNQSLQPDIFLINISKESYLKDEGFSITPHWMKSNKITVNWVENTGSYRKLIPALKYADRDDLVITSDDDVIYGKEWLKDIVDAALADPDAIICAMARYMKKNFIGNWQNYARWSLVEKPFRGLFIVPIGCAGIAYRKKNLDLEFLQNRKYLDIAPTTDDLWFKMASLLKRVPVSVLPQINHNNRYIKDGRGLDTINLAKMNSSSFVWKLFEKLWIETADYFGINRSPNDFSWDAICKYTKFFAAKERGTS